MDKVTVVIKTGILVFLPFFSYMFLKKNYNFLFENKEFEIKFGSLYSSLDTKKRALYTYTTTFCIRRLLVAIGTVYLRGYNIVLIYITIFSSFYMVKYQIEH